MHSYLPLARKVNDKQTTRYSYVKKHFTEHRLVREVMRIDNRRQHVFYRCLEMNRNEIIECMYWISLFN
jgi:hypothetical protein